MLIQYQGETVEGTADMLDLARLDGFSERGRVWTLESPSRRGWRGFVASSWGREGTRVYFVALRG
jgi:hypothetical protein